MADRRRFRGTVEYDGTDYYGFQIQPEAPTIQGELEAALRRIARRYDGEAGVRVVGAGRTDAGVHALGQVVHFDSRWARSEEELRRALNAVLPAGIAVKRLETAADDFHARYSATSREYMYSVFVDPTRSPLKERYALRVEGRVCVERMNEAAAFLEGTHDYAAFGQPPTGSTTLRTVHRVVWVEESEQLRFRIVGNSYLRGMVRRLVGTLLWVGTGRTSVENFLAILRSGDISRSAPPVPAAGLCLVRVDY